MRRNKSIALWGHRVTEKAKVSHSFHSFPCARSQQATMPDTAGLVRQIGSWARIIAEEYLECMVQAASGQRWGIVRTHVFVWDTPGSVLVAC